MVNLFTQLLNISILASYLIIAVIAVRFLFKKVPKSIMCILWILVGIRLVLPVLPETSFSLLPSNQVFEESEYYENLPAIHTGYEALDYSLNTQIQEQYQEMPVTADGAFFDVTTQPYTEMTEIVENVSGYQKVFLWGTTVWLLGMFVLLGYFLYSWGTIKSKVRTAIPEEIDGMKIYRCDGIDTPFLFGIQKPRIYIPWELNGAELQSVLSHEKAHLERRDYLLKPVFFLLLILHWFNPLVWAAYLLLCRDIEFACDERVLRKLGESGKRKYSEALLSCSVNRSRLAGYPVAFGEGDVKSRIKRVLSYQKPAIWVMIGAVIICILVVLLFMTGKKSSVNANTIQYGDYEITLTQATACEETQLIELELLISSKKADTEALTEFVQNITMGSGFTGENKRISDTEYRKTLNGYYMAGNDTIENALTVHTTSVGTYLELGTFPVSLVQYQEAKTLEADSDFGKVRLTFSSTTMMLECLEGKPATNQIYTIVLNTASGEEWMVWRFPVLVSEEPEYTYDKEIYYDYAMGDEMSDVKVWRFTPEEEIPLDAIIDFSVNTITE